MTAMKNVSPKNKRAKPAASSPAVRFRWARLRSIGVFYHTTSRRSAPRPEPPHKEAVSYQWSDGGHTRAPYARRSSRALMSTNVLLTGLGLVIVLVIASRLLAERLRF